MNEGLAPRNTRLRLALATFEGELVSRSQARHVAARLDCFSEVELDFEGVPSIGQGFADELFRVWPLVHAETLLVVTNASVLVQKMLAHVQARKDLPQPRRPVRQGPLQ